jgi:hypothetical protein
MISVRAIRPLKHGDYRSARLFLGRVARHQRIPNAIKKISYGLSCFIKVQGIIESPATGIDATLINSRCICEPHSVCSFYSSQSHLVCDRTSLPLLRLLRCTGRIVYEEIIEQEF